MEEQGSIGFARQAFREAYRARDGRADINRDGRLNVLDLAAFIEQVERAERAAVVDGEPAEQDTDLSVFLDPSVQVGTLGVPFTIDVQMDFTTQPTLGGAFDVQLAGMGDAVLDWSFDSSTIGDDPVFRHDPVSSPGRLTGIAVGSLDGVSGPGVVGTITVTPTVSGSAFLGPEPSVLSPWVANDTFEIQLPAYVGAELTFIEPDAVPLSAPMMGLFLLLLGGAGVRVARRRSDLAEAR